MPLRLDNARALPTCPQQEQQKKQASRDSRLTTRLCRCQKPNSQNASRPGRHQIGMVGEIISESWARSNRYTRARSSESALIARATAADVMPASVDGIRPLRTRAVRTMRGEGAPV